MTTELRQRPRNEIPRVRIDAVIKELRARIYEAEWLDDNALAQYLRENVDRLEFARELGETYVVSF
jgi:hypothetical protein